MKKFAEPLGALTPFGAVRVFMPDCTLSGPIERNFCLSQKDAKKLYRQLGSAIKKQEKDYAKFVRTLTKRSPFKQLLKGGKFSPSPEIRGVK